MQQVFERDYIIPPSACDFSGQLAYPGAFAVFMDLATEHAERLGVGLRAMRAKERFWLTVKTKLVFLARPAISERVRLLTWPEKPGPLRFDRSYELRRGDALLIAGRTEWAVMNTAAGTLAPSADILPAGMVYERGPALEERYARIPPRFEGEPFAAYRVRSTDIDLGGHMNNAAYPRALFGLLSSEEVAARDIRSIDLIFRAPCYEGEELDVRRREDGGALDLCMSKGEQVRLLARLAEARPV